MTSHRLTRSVGAPAPSPASGSLSSGTPFRRLQTRPLNQRRSRISLSRLANLGLLLVELAAVAALAWWVYTSIAEWRSLAEAEPLPAGTTETSWMATNTVLPGGHEAPSQASVPAHLRALIQPTAMVPLPTAAPGRASRLVIEKTGVDAPVLQGDSDEQLRMGVGHRLGTAGPGQVGNLVLSGHNDIYGQVFRDLDRLAEGDLITVYSRGEPFTYVVKQKLIVEPTDLSVLEPSQRPILTLISCYPYLVDSHRIVVIAELSH